MRALTNGALEVLALMAAGLLIIGKLLARKQ